MADNSSNSNGGCLIWVIIIVAVLIFSSMGSHSSNSTTTSNSKTSTSSSQTLTAQTAPSNGDILDGTSEGNARITINASSNASAYVKVINTNDSTQVGFYISAGKSASVDVPEGTYNIHFAQGTTWYGKANRFGNSTAYGQDKNQQLDFGVELEYSLSYTSSGNFSMESLSANNF